MIRSFSKSKLAIFACLLAISVSALGVFNFIKDSEVWHAKNVNAQSCKGPADVVLVVDRSATMANDLKFSTVKSACNSFIDDLFAATPDVSYHPYDYHQVGLVAFNNNVDSEQLNKSGSYIQGVINNCDGILGESSYPSGYRQTSIAIQRAKEELDSDLSPTNPSATRTMIVLTDGPPHYNIPLAKTNADIAKSNGVRIVAVGLKLDEIVDPTKKAEAEDFIKYIASTPSDCYYTSDSGSTLDGCVSISGADLEAALAEVYNNITASICDESPPVLNIYRTPQGTLYNVDELLIRSVAFDNVGFKSHTLIWSDNWPDDLIIIECTDLSGFVIECDTGAIGPFFSGEILNYRSVAVDANDNEECISEPDPRGVTVASVILNVPSLFRNIDNTISVSIFDPNGKADLDSFLITVDAPTLEGEEVIQAPMTCTGTGSNRICNYDFNPGCDWRDGITGGIADNLNVNVYIYADSSDVPLRQIISAENQLLVSYSEGANWAGTCSDGINNDCDYTDSDPNQPIIDLAEMSCDTEDPLISISRVPGGDIYNDDTIVFTSTATDTNGIRQHTIYYREDGGSWQIAFDCNDANADSDCDEDPSQDVGSIQATTGVFTAGVEVEYYSTAIDYSGGSNSGSTAVESFIVKNRECEGIGDLNACNITPGGKCCGEVCNVAISNPNSYNIDSCAMEICNGASWEWGPDPGNDGVVCVDGSDSDGCYTYGGFWDGGCEERAYTCSSGQCLYNVSNRHNDHCFAADSLILNDYECVGNSCLLDPDPSVTNDVCDLMLDDLSLNAYNNENNLIVTEVLDIRTEPLNKVSLAASVNDVSGIEEYKIYWREDGGIWHSTNCGPCGDGVVCNCAQEIGPYTYGTTVDYYAWARDGSVNHIEETEAASNGLRYYYYDGTGFNTYLGSDIDTDINHTWGSGQININGNSWENQSSTVSIIWEGIVAPNVLGTHTFYMYSDDGIRLDIDGSRLIDHWGYSGSEYSATYDFTSLDPVSIRIEWYEGWGAATLRLGWEEPGGAKTYPIPSSNLFSPYYFTVYDHDCYYINSHADQGNLADLTPCGPGDSLAGRCCSGTCDASQDSNPYDSECSVDSCSGINWASVPANEDSPCGAVGTCFDYYTGCMGGNKCISGYCSPDQIGVQVDFCNNNLFNDYDCWGGPKSCQVVSADVDCSSNGDSDGDGIACDCDCDNYDIEEKVYSSLSFDGVDDYINFGDVLDPDINSFSVELWFKWDGKSGENILYDKRDLYMARVYDGYFRYAWQPHWSWDGGNTFSVNAGEWYHAVVVYDKTKQYIYKNGQLVYSRNQEGDMGSNNYSFLLGARRSSDPYNFFNGSIDEVRVYNRALYSQEIEDHYNGVFLKSDIDLGGYWNLDEGSGKIAADSSVNGYDGALSNTDGEVFDGSNWTTGRYGNGISLDGNDYVNIPFSLGDPSAMSLEFWFYVDESDKTRTQYLMDGRGGGNWWFLQSYNPSGSGNINFNNRVQISSDDWDAGQWNHLILTTDSTESKIYINGDLKATGSGYNPDIGVKMRIGTRYTNSRYFRGKFDEARVYNRVLPEGDVLDHYNNVFNNETGLLGHWNFNEGMGAVAYDNSENSPQWEKYYYGSTSGVNGNVPINWQVCTDSKDNDCDGYTDDYDNSNGISDCDGEVDGISVVASAKNRNGVENSDLFDTNFDLTTYDIDIERTSNNFTITANAIDDFLIQQTTIEWTTDNWINKDSKTCNNTGICKTCIEGAYSETGMTESGSNNTLVDNDKSWDIDEWQSFIVKIISGTGTGQVRTIASNTDTQLTVDSDWTTWPDATSEYEINKCENESTGTATGLGGSRTLTDNTKSWVNNEWLDGIIEIISGTGTGQIKNIVSNTIDEITVDSDWGVSPNTNSQYQISKKGDVISPLSLSAGTTFDFKVCTWDNSVNNNKDCTEYYSIIILNSNIAPEIIPLSTQEPDFCDGDLGYILKWSFSDMDGDEQLSYKIQVKEGDNDFTNDLVIDTEKYLADSYYQILSGDFKPSKEIEYGKTYYWQAKITDDRGGGYEQSTDWTEGPSFDMPVYEHPQIDFSAIPDYTSPSCLFDIGQEGTSECSFGENITFSDDSIFVECDNADSSQCVTSNESRCNIPTMSCVACIGDAECAKFGASHWCNGGICSPPVDFVCNTDDDCKMADNAKCDNEFCIFCDNDSQCTSVASGYTCQRNGICENPERHEWYFYSNYGGVPDSNSSSPVNNYIKSVTDSYFITLGVKDIFGNSCFGTKKIFFDVETRYPKWNETSPSGPN